MNIELYNKQGKLVDYLYQWDRDIELTIKNNTNHTISEIHFSNLLTDCTAVCIPHENGTKVNVPNIFLTKIHALTLHFCHYNENGGFETFFEYIIPIRPRQKPEDYIYTEAEIATWKKLCSRIDDIETRLAENEIPDYWENHIAERASKINNLQEEGGKDCFSFAVLADMHYPTNLGKKSPLIAKKLMEECNIKYALCLGDTQTRGCHGTKELLLAENQAIEEMLSPIRSSLLQTEGNHDGAYGFLDRNGDGISNTDKEPDERETYVNNLTPAELHRAIYRKVGLVGNIHFDERGSGYYIDDTSSKVRYIVLNTQCNDDELQEDGTAKYPKMWLFRFTQSQFNLVLEALSNIPSDSWSVVVAGHCPLWQEIGDANVMIGVLNAYKNKTTYKGEYLGTAAGGEAYENLANPSDENWKDGYRIGSTDISVQSGKTTTNLIPCVTGDVIRVKGVDFVAGNDRVCFAPDENYSGAYSYVSVLPNNDFGYELINGVHTFTILNTNSAYKYFRCCFNTPAHPSEIIITVNQPIIEAEHGYDYVYVDADFSNAKGQLAGYFSGHVHYDHHTTDKGFPIISTRCDAKEENTEDLKNERIAGTVTEQSFDIFTINKATKKIYATKIGAGDDREIDF